MRDGTTMTLAITTPVKRQVSNAMILASRVLNEPVMGLLSLIALATALGPMVFDLPANLERSLVFLEWIVVVVFAAEFVVQLGIAEDPRAWLRSPWRIVDLLAILGPVAALLPQVSSAARGSLILRLLRVGRAVAFGTRAGTVAAHTRPLAHHVAQHGPPVVSVVSAETEAFLEPARSDWNSFVSWTKEPGPAWYHASSVDQVQFRELARSSGLEPIDFERFLDPNAQSQFHTLSKHTLLLLWVPTVNSHGFPVVQRHRLLVLATESGAVTAIEGSLDLQSSVARLSRRNALPKISFPPQIVCALLALASERYNFVSQRFEDELTALESVPIAEGGSVFFTQTFQLRREIASVGIDLLRLKSVVRALADGKTTMRGANLADEKFLDDLAAATDGLHLKVAEQKEHLKAMIELHINVTSFQMNRFMKVLAIISFLGLIPSVAGGLLGMNVDGNPWPVTLGQVAFGIGMAMAASIYFFAIKGWLR